MDPKLAAAVAYLRSRNLYLFDKGNSFRYTPSHQTDIRNTIGDEIADVRIAPLYPPLDTPTSIDSVE